MIFSTWQQALDMQGHGIYVWPAYAIGVAVLVIFALVLRARTRQLLRKLQRQVEQMQQVEYLEKVQPSDKGAPRASIT